ncbi:MAG: hypothetical protein U0984_07885 [Prosthecobacter sp.]|nr:hypothetical protein [Prosthecobacter sp.]
MNSEDDSLYDRKKHYIATGILTIALTILFLPWNHDKPSYLLIAPVGWGLPSFFIAGWWEGLKSKNQIIVAILAAVALVTLVPWFLVQVEEAKSDAKRERLNRYELEDQYENLSPGARAEIDRLRSGER